MAIVRRKPRWWQCRMTSGIRRTPSAGSAMSTLSGKFILKTGYGSGSV
jgi:hypothetical protein